MQRCSSYIWPFLFFHDRSSTAEANPNVSGKDSTASVTSTGSNSDSGSTSSSEGSDLKGDIDFIDNDDFAKEESGLSMVSLKVRVTYINILILVCQDILGQKAYVRIDETSRYNLNP